MSFNRDRSVDTKKTENNKQGGTIHECGTGYAEECIRIVEKPFDASNGTKTPFGKRWGANVIKLNTAHLAALIDGKTLALDVQSEYILFVQTQAAAHQESTIGEEGAGATHSTNQKGGCDG